ncbi:hypothetical protein [Roseomonas sp. WA12]
MRRLSHGQVKIISVQSMLDPWTGEQQVAVLYEDVEGGCVVMLSEERCEELDLRRAAREGRAIPTPRWRK